MKLIVRKEPLRRILKWSQRALFACAILLLGYCGFALADAWLFQRREARDLDRLLRDRRAASQVDAATGIGCLSEGRACRRGG